MAKKNNGGSTAGMAFVVILALGFLGFLFYLATVPPSNDFDAVKADAKKGLQQGKKQIQESDKKAPKPVAKPNYDFYQLLENQTVEVPKVDAYVSTPKDESISYQYLLQVASFRSQEDADALRASLLLEGMPAYTKGTEVNNKSWYRVYVGPFDNRSKMNQAQDKLVARSLSPLELKETKTK